MRARDTRLILAALLVSLGCAHESIWLGDPPVALSPPGAPVGLTMALRPGSFERARLPEAAVLQRFATALRDAKLFVAVMYPIPPGVEPTWSLELSASDSALEPDANFWKAFLASALPPLAFFVTFENDYTLELEARITRAGAELASYRGRAPIRNRYQLYSPMAQVDLEGVELAVSGAGSAVLKAVESDLSRLVAADRD